ARSLLVYEHDQAVVFLLVEHAVTYEMEDVELGCPQHAEKGVEVGSRGNLELEGASLDEIGCGLAEEIQLPLHLDLRQVGWARHHDQDPQGWLHHQRRSRGRDVDVTDEGGVARHDEEPSQA